MAGGENIIRKRNGESVSEISVMAAWQHHGAAS